MKEDLLTQPEQSLLLSFARQSLVAEICRQPFDQPDLSALPERLTRLGASFVTLTHRGKLRGCIGALEAYMPLVQDVCEHAVLAATEDFRFQPVRPAELPDICIEISCLTPPNALEYERPEELLERLRPGIDGVILRHGGQRATFLPQVWEKLPLAEDFLAHLCYKMGAPADFWRHAELKVFTYQVQSFEETPSSA